MNDKVFTREFFVEAGRRGGLAGSKEDKSKAGKIGMANYPIEKRTAVGRLGGLSASKEARSKAQLLRWAKWGRRKPVDAT